MNNDMNNDLISRSDLIKWIDDSVSQYGHTYSTDMLNMWGLFKDYLINKAPTVDIKDQIAGAYNEGYMCGNKEAEKARPQGEWLFHRCSLCGRYDARDNENFCSNCGADMRKGGAV